MKMKMPFTKTGNTEGRVYKEGSRIWFVQIECKILKDGRGKAGIRDINLGSTAHSVYSHGNE